MGTFFAGAARRPTETRPSGAGQAARGQRLHLHVGGRRRPSRALGGAHRTTARRDDRGPGRRARRRGGAHHPRGTTPSHSVPLRRCGRPRRAGRLHPGRVRTRGRPHPAQAHPGPPVRRGDGVAMPRRLHKRFEPAKHASHHRERRRAMSVILGTGAYRYEVVDQGAKLPPGREFNADVAAVGVDGQDRVYAFNRGQHPMVVFDRDGNFLRSWGEGVFRRAHGVHMAPDDTLWLTDDGDHTVRHCTLDGRVLLTIGIPGAPKPYMSGEPFHRCTHTALSPQGDLYVSDGYGNSRVHKFAPNGALLLSWGEPGTDPGQFNIPHNICCDPDGWVYVADRENHRVQVFDGNGKYEAQWNNMHRPSGLYMESGTKTPRFFIGEIGPDMAVNIDLPKCGPR